MNGRDRPVDEWSVPGWGVRARQGALIAPGFIEGIMMENIRVSLMYSALLAACWI